MSNFSHYQKGRAIGALISLASDIAISSWIGHHFHSAAIGFGAMAVLSSLSGINLKLTRLVEGR